MKKLVLFCALLLGTLLSTHHAQAQSLCAGGCVQYNSNEVFSGSSVAASLPTVTAGNGIHAMACFFTATSITSADLNGTAATVSTNLASNPGNYSCATIAAANAAGGTNTLTVNFAGTCGDCFVYMEEWHGDASSTTLDASNGTYTIGADSSSIPCGSITTTNANDVLEAFAFIPGNVAPTVLAGYAFAVTTGAVPGPYYSAYDSVAATGTYNPGFTSGPMSADNYVVCGAFKQSGSPPPAGHILNQLMLHAS